MTIRPFTDSDRAAVMAIAEDLVEWFDERARRRSIPIDLHHQEVFVAIDDRAPVGFITLYVAEGRLNIGWLCVRRDRQRRGIGSALLRKAEETARALGISELATHTLGDSVDYAPYEQTRNFYFKNGFKVYQRSKTDNPGCPEEIRISKRVGPQTAAPDD